MSQITVITATLPDREELLREAMASVRAQTLQPADHLVAVDYQRRGGFRPRNLLASGVATEWIQILDDDDLLLPEHLETLVPYTAEADVVYSYCHSEGDAFELYNRPFDPELLKTTSIVSHNAIVRTSLVLDLGGWDEEKGYDWRFWVRAAAAGASFLAVPQKTWVYRLTPTWRHESRP